MENAFLITFKPSTENSELGWPLSKYKEVVNDFQAAGSVNHNWRFNSYKKVSPGDRVFLALQGHNGPAILGYGKVVGEATNKDGPWRAPIHFEMIVDPETEILATKEELKAITTEHSVWGAQGPPGVGKSFIAENLSFALMGTKNREALKRIQFHQSYSYEDFIQGYRPTDSGFILKDGVFTKFCNQAASDPNQIYVFVIDEINRGNLSKILGELMVLIEPDKRGPKWEMPLTYNEEPFYVPDNLYILGMMNTADRSLSLVDYALRRRFSFMEIKPQFESTQFKEFMRSKGADDRLIDFIINSMRKLNDAIREDTISLGEGFCIGHSYFCPSTSTAPDLNWYRDQIEAEIIPLLKEYWFDDHKKVDEWSKNLLEKFD